MARDGDEPPNRRRSALLRRAAHRAASGFTLLFTLFSLTPATPRGDTEGEGATEVPEAALNKLVLGLTLLFALLSLAASTSLVVYTAWTHDLENGAFALAVAVATARIAMNWLVWKDEEE